MALQCLRRPVLTALGPNGVRNFAVVFPRAAAQQPQMHQPKQPPEQSQNAMMQSMHATMAQIPTDIGLFPDTFVTPELRNYPLSPEKLPKFLFVHVKQRFWDRVSSWVYKWASAKPRPKIGRRKLAPAAVGLYQEMYTAFANGNRTKLRKICCSGLCNNFMSRISSRGRETLQWELVELSSSRLVSDRTTRLPIDNAYVRQAVVRIKSIQKLTRFRSDGSVVPGSGEPRSVVENVVIQKRILKDEQDEWMVWGLTEETTFEKIIEAEEAKQA